MRRRGAHVLLRRGAVGARVRAAAGAGAGRARQGRLPRGRGQLLGPRPHPRLYCVGARGGRRGRIPEAPARADRARGGAVWCAAAPLFLGCGGRGWWCFVLPGGRRGGTLLVQPQAPLYIALTACSSHLSSSHPWRALAAPPPPCRPQGPTEPLLQAVSHPAPGGAGGAGGGANGGAEGDDDDTEPLPGDRRYPWLERRLQLLYRAHVSGWGDEGAGGGQ